MDGDNRPLQALLLRWSGRVVIGVANLAAVSAEAPATIINRITYSLGHYAAAYLGRNAGMKAIGIIVLVFAVAFVFWWLAHLGKK